jgi:hypothetical protein
MDKEILLYHPALYFMKICLQSQDIALRSRELAWQTAWH